MAFYCEKLSHKVPSSSVSDVTPPTFSGITGLVVKDNGALLSSWGAASDATAPIFYEIYVKASNATSLFTSTYIVARVAGLSFNIFQDSLGNLLSYNTTYYVGVRAVDALNNINTNVVSMNAISKGVANDSTFNSLTEIKNLVIAGL